MKQFYLITNRMKDAELVLTNRIRDELQKQGAHCTVHVQEEKDGRYHTDSGDIPQDCECIIVLGGDGTLLEAARDTADRDIPLIGVNLGTLGYLAEVDRENLSGALTRLCEDDYTIERRMMLEGQITGERDCRRSYALNDIVVSRSGSLQMLHFYILVNGHFLKGYSADGIIVSTPTGSTGYNMSAGGPIVEPSAELMVITPICPHTLNTRSIVLSPDDEIEIELLPARDGRTQQVEADFDGAYGLALAAGDRMRIVRSKRTTAIVKLSGAGFLEVLHRKMRES
ncbi:MAG: NAD(+)/NADH kinase [Clostridium sp.]|nr:NAD(+)/NADH kinase [Clostridium sp.]